MTRSTRFSQPLFPAFTLFLLGSFLPPFSTAVADSPTAESHAKKRPSELSAVVDGTLVLNFDPSALADLDFRIVARSHDETASTGNSFTFPVAPGSTLRWHVDSDGVPIITRVDLAACGALLLDRPGERAVITNPTLRVHPGGVMTLNAVLDDTGTEQPVFDLTSIWIEAPRHSRVLRLVAELSLSHLAAERWVDPNAAGKTLGSVTLVADRAAWDQASPLDAACQADAPPFDADAFSSAVASTASVGPDVLVADLQSTVRFDRIGDITAFAIGTTACNIGTQRVDWIAYTNQHPVIVQNLFRLKEDRFEQVGLAWVKHGFYTVSQSVCSPCNDPTDGSQLGVGCSDPYSATLNGVQTNMSPRSEVNAHTGYFPYPWSGPAPGSSIERRLQVRDADLHPASNPGARYFIEGHYVTPDDAAAGTADNNASYREVTISNPSAGMFSLVTTSSRPTQRGEAGVRAWRDVDPSVMETDVRVPDEGLFILAAKSVPTGSGTHRFTYALQNLNSDRSARSFAIPLPRDAMVDNILFHDVAFHSGEPYVSTDWTAVVADGYITWSTDTYDANPNTNALRYGTVYTFGFDVNVESGEDKAVIGLFKPGTPDEVTAYTVAPRLSVIDCNSNEIPDRCDLDCDAVACTPPCGASADCNENQVPDECEPDCNRNGIADACDIADCTPGELSCADCNNNFVPDGCEEDCDDDGIPDACDPPGDADGDGIDDCLDLCPETTPVGACLCPPLGRCCFPVGICINDYPRTLCTDQGGTPDCIAPPCRYGCLLGDWDDDGDLDIRDFAAVQNCFSGSAGASENAVLPELCARNLDFDTDDDVDLVDFANFHELCTGP